MRPARALTGVVFLVALLSLASGILLGPGPTGSARASGDYPPLTGTIHGPSYVGIGLQASYHLTGTGGPAIALANGTQVGVLSFSTSVVGANTTGVQLLPTAGVLTNGSANLTLVVTNVTQTLTLSVEIKSGYQGQNVTTNLTYSVNVVEPYTVSAQIVVASNQNSLPFDVAVSLDGNPVGTVHVPSLTAHANYQVLFHYVNPGLSAGWHTFSLSLANAHGLLLFTNGQGSYTQSFYVAGSPSNDTIYYVLGVMFFVGIAFIWLTGSGGRRRGRRRT